MLASLAVCPAIPDVPKIEPIVFDSISSYISWCFQREEDFRFLKTILRIVGHDTEIKADDLVYKEPVEGIDYIFSKDFYQKDIKGKMEG